MKFKWSRSPDFAEVAEVLGITTRQVLAAAVSGETLIVVYTPDQNGKPPFWRARMGRDADNILVVKGDPVELDTPEDWQRFLGDE